MKLSIIEGWKEGQSNVIISCIYLEERFHECSKKEGVIMATSVETTGVDLIREPSERSRAEKRCEVRFSLVRMIGSSRNII